MLSLPMTFTTTLWPAAVGLVPIVDWPASEMLLKLYSAGAGPLATSTR